MQQLIGRVEIHPVTGECRIEYVFGIDPNNLGEIAGNESDLLGFEPMVIVAYSTEACHPVQLKAATQTASKLPPIGA